jgi:DNA (cytosine-5)-methyltransferase 1
MLVLSLFPGIGLLDMAFELEGFCVVRGPDVLWGGDIRAFHPPAGRFDGVIGGPPCQAFSALNHLLRASGKKTSKVDLVPDFVRCVEESRPAWFIMENVIQATQPRPDGFLVRDCDVHDGDCGGDTKRIRRIWFGTQDGRPLIIAKSLRRSLIPLERAVTRNVRIPRARHFAKAAARGGGVLPGDGEYAPLEDCCELQGLPRTFFSSLPFRKEAARIMLGNGVPLPMGRAIAKAVKEAVYQGGESC